MLKEKEKKKYTSNLFEHCTKNFVDFVTQLQKQRNNEVGITKSNLNLGNFKCYNQPSSLPLNMLRVPST